MEPGLQNLDRGNEATGHPSRRLKFDRIVYDELTVELQPHTRSEPDESPRVDDETPTQLVALIRNQNLSVDPTILERIDRAIDRASDDETLGDLYIARALALQGQGSAAPQAAAARNAIPHLVAAGTMESAAFASAIAAVYLDQIGEPSAAVDHAVDALVMLADADDTTSGLLEVDGVRAALALAGFFMRLSAFGLAVDTAQQAFRSSRLLSGFPIDFKAYSAGYIAVEGAHVTNDMETRAEYLAAAEETADWLRTYGVDDSSRTMLANGLFAEIRHVRGEDSSDLELDDAETFYDVAAKDLVAWHQLVRGASAQLRGDADAAIALYDAALPGLEASSDDHCIVRALRGRSQSKALVGDLAGALEDAMSLAERTRRWQIDNVGRLAAQLARRADLERSTIALRTTAARLTNDIEHDATTGVNSRRWLERRLDEIATSKGYGSTLMCDIDQFKSVNDTYGHHIGDDALRAFGVLLTHTIGHADMARFGGEEFAIILSDGNEMSATLVAERVRAAVEQHDWDVIAPGLALTISCGVAFGRLSNVRGLLVAADEALLDAKRRGRNRVVSAFSTHAN